MTTQVFIEEHLDKYLKSLVKGQLFIPGVIIGQVIGNNYHIVHLSAMTVWNDDIENNKIDVLSFKTLSDLLANSDTIFQKSLEVATLLPGGSHVLGLFFIVPQDLKSIQPIDIDFHEFNSELNESLLYKKANETWNYLILNYSIVNKKSYCYSVDFSRVRGPEKTTYKAVDSVFGSFNNDWITLIGTFNFGTLDRLNVGGGPKALFSIRDSLLDKFESVLNQSVCTFNGRVCDENKTFKDFECDEIDNVLKNAVKVEFYREVDLGDECKNASLTVKRGKGKISMSGLCSVVVPFNRNGTIKDAIKAIHEDAMQTFATRLKMHLESMVEEESLEEEGSYRYKFGTCALSRLPHIMGYSDVVSYSNLAFYGDANIVHETPRRILILKTEGSRFAFSDYVFPGETSQEALCVAGEILNLPEDKMELYDMLEKGRHSYYETLPDIDSSPPQDASISSPNNMFIYLTWAALILAILAYAIKQIFV